MKRQVWVSVLVGSLFLSLGSTVLRAQSTAEISGTVRDQTGAVLPGVEVTATQTDTGVKRSTVTNETGSYALTNLALGPYRLEAGLPGFRTFVQTGIVLQVNGSPVINISTPPTIRFPLTMQPPIRLMSVTAKKISR
jgi:hypothetical protein